MKYVGVGVACILGLWFSWAAETNGLLLFGAVLLALFSAFSGSKLVSFFSALIWFAFTGILDIATGSFNVALADATTALLIFSLLYDAVYSSTGGVLSSFLVSVGVLSLFMIYQVSVY